MNAPLRMRRVLAACILSNAVFATAGLVVMSGNTASVVVSAANTTHGHASAAETNDSTTTTVLTSGTSPTDRSSVPASLAPRATQSPSSHASSSTRTPTTSAAAAAGDVTGITSSAAPPPASYTRIAPDAGSYPASFSGNAAVNGKAQSVPSSGAVVFTATGSDLRQSTPNTPGDVKITQHFTAGRITIDSFEMKAGSNVTSFTPSGVATFVPFGSPQGTSWSWSATSTDGGTQVTTSAQTGGTQTINVGGTAVQVFEVDTSITLSGDINGTASITLWESTEHRLPIQQHQVINASMSSGYGFTTRFVSDVTSTLTSLSPA